MRSRDEGRCRYCGESGTEIDHVIPRHKGGVTNLTNLVLACQSCNRRKGEERGFLLREGVLHYLGEEVHPNSLFGEELMERVVGRRRTRQVRSGLAWAIERYGTE